MGRPEVLPVTHAPAPVRRRWPKIAAGAALLLLAPLGCGLFHGTSLTSTDWHLRGDAAWAVQSQLGSKAACAQAEPLLPSTNVSSFIGGNERRIIDWLAGAVRIPTEIFDVMGEIGVDERWDVFYKFADYLETAFPLVHKHLTRTRVMTHALVFEWQGSDPTLKPLLLTGHQDVVPVLPATRDQWTHDPYGGEYDGTYIWGRGSVDDKSGTIGALSAIELLLESGKFQPARTVILSLGIDEETGGAYNLNEWLEAKYGRDSMAILVDEGSGMLPAFGQMFALPAVAEKGYLDVEVKVETVGGHSSVPPAHTGIGLMSLALAELERHPHEPYLNPTSPVVEFLSCAAVYAPDTPKKLKKDITKVTDSLSRGKKVDAKSLRRVQDMVVSGTMDAGFGGTGKALVATTQAIDIINGGVKVNALPEVVTAYVNHRISITSNVDELEHRITKVLAPVAKKYNLAFEAWGNNVSLCHHDDTNAKPKTPSAGKLTISAAWHSELNPAPVSPYTLDSPAWRVLAGTVRGVWDTRSDELKEEYYKYVGHQADEIYMAPLMSTGNTDTKRYWNLTRNIYRFAYLTFTGKMNNVHTVDEHIEASVYIEQVRWFMNFIVNVDESREDF